MMLVKGNSNDDEVIWTSRPWIIPSLLEETTMAFIVFIISLFVELIFGVAYISILGEQFITLTGLCLLFIWLINAFHLILVRSSSQYVLRRNGFEMTTGIFKKRSFTVSPSSSPDIVVMQSIIGKILGSGEIFIRIWGEGGREIRMGRVRNPSILAEDIRKISSI
jgi:uncharacterized membrane protein YdbT with pleckstrin-like domain